jgi:hypothetical protein
MAKLLEKNGAEMCSALVSLAAPIRSFLDDPEVGETFRKCTQKGIDNKLSGLLTIYADMVPQLFGEKHLKDTLAILAVVEGKSVREMLKMNGVELMKDALNAWKEQIQPFFTQLGLSD